LTVPGNEARGPGVTGWDSALVLLWDVARENSVDSSWRPVPGQVALVEYAGADASAATRTSLTGLVLADQDGHVTVDLGTSGPPGPGSAEVVVSFFSPDALYRVRATAQPGDPPAIIELNPVIDVERIQRRQFPRVPLRVPVVLSSFDEQSSGFVSITGSTIDLGAGGVRVETSTPFPAGADPTVSLALDTGRHLVARTRVVLADVEADHCEYRLAFVDLSDDDLAIVDRVVDEFRGRVG
jgi:hypothetical protein